MGNHSEICPICRGSGVFIVMVDPHNHGSSGEAQRINCHGCGGYGWVVVSDDTVVAVVTE